MRRPTRLAEDDVLRVVASYLDGTAVLKLAEQFEVTGSPIRRSISARPSEERIAEAVQFCEAGQSLRALARHLEISADRVRKVLGEAGVEIRRR